MLLPLRNLYNKIISHEQHIVSDLSSAVPFSICGTDGMLRDQPNTSNNVQQQYSGCMAAYCMFWLLDSIRQISSRSRIARPHPEKSLRGEVWCRKVKIALTGSLAFCANTAKVDSLLHRHLVWETAGDGSVWQLSASQFSSPASLLIGYRDNTHKHTHRKKREWINWVIPWERTGEAIVNCAVPWELVDDNCTPNAFSNNGPQVHQSCFYNGLSYSSILSVNICLSYTLPGSHRCPTFHHSLTQCA